MRQREETGPFLTLEELEAIASDVKDDLQRQANQGIRKKDWEQGIGSLASMEAIDSFLYNCRLRAGQFSSPSHVSKRKKKSEPIAIEKARRIAGAK